MVVLADSQATTPPAEEPQPQPRRQRAVRTVETPQMEDADCGAACLSIILTHHGRRVPLAELRDRCGVGRDGMTASGFARAAAGYGLKVTGRWIETSDLDMASRVPVPAVVFLDGRHYAVLEGVRRGRAWINDPAVGRLPLTPAEFATRANGPVLVATPTPEFEPGGERWPFARAVAQRIRPYAPMILAGALLGGVAAVPTLLASLTMRAVLNRVLILGDLAWRPALLAILVGGALLAALAGWAQQRIFATALAAMATRFSSRYLTALLRLPGEFFHRRHLSGLVNRTQMNDGLAIALSERVVLPAAAAVSVAGYGLFIGYLAPRLLVVMSLAMAAQIVLLNVVRRRAGPHQQRLLFEQLRRDSTAHSGLKMIESVKADGAERWLFASWARSAGRTLDAANALASATLGVMALSAAVGPAALAGLALVGAHDVAAGRIDLGTLLTAQLVGGAMLAPLGLLVGLGSEIQVTRVHVSVIDDALAATPHPARATVLAPDAPPEPAQPARLSGRIEFDRVSFGYDRHRPPLVRDISFAVEPGQWVALVGVSGSGKSTLARLAVGAAEPWSGAVLLDGRPRETYSRRTLAASIGYVEQQLRLFEGNLRDNLTLWDPTLPEERLRAALVDARIDRLVEQRGGLDHGAVNEHARNLSGGEQQRLELARALAADPPLLVLDEATSALDATTEFAVLEALRRRGVTCMFIAHRISTVRDADLILVLDRGEIVQRGTHAELIDTDGVYRRLATDGRSA
ncbi:ATP-binding cassette domain-containing protein [Micromonospora gifhornensis]|uniref:ATP-binding cassette domain-containing protein n=1 Tax=Micromonospora gifhornensis TaxID=84594 RepID=UPI0034518672